MSDKHLIVYKASAGSGKTFTLVYEYIKYLYIEQSGFITKGYWIENVHRQILAVTFTNKSTIEMKERIINSLHSISCGTHSLYIRKLKEDIPVLARLDDDKVIKDTAARLMSDILQDYSLFRVQTIDAFFQQIIRSFANELNLNNNYAVELDGDSILEEAVDNMLSSLTPDDSNNILEWLTEFTKDQIEDRNSWNPRSGLIKLSKLLMSESYILNREEDQTDCSISELKEYKRRLKGIVADFKTKIDSICSEVHDILRKYGLEPDDTTLFKAHTLSPFSWNYLQKNKFNFTATFIKTVENESWIKAKKTAEPELISCISACAGRLVECCRGEDKRRYVTANAVLKNMYILGILNEIQNNVSRICRDNDCMIISSTSDFIHQVIKGADTPFIYEKVGVTTKHFMIDEFQDTSGMQWKNFVPLLHESVDNGNESLLVGDVKQSIYRWRNGDWKILHENVTREFNGNVQEKNLEFNYRSEKKIIEFNNCIYGNLPNRIDGKLRLQIADNVSINLTDVYGNVIQKTDRTTDDGYVRCRFFDDNKELDFEEESLDDLVSVLSKRRDYSGTAILVRTNAEAEIIARRLDYENIPFFSNNALNVASDKAVKLIVATIRYVIQDDENLVYAEFVSLYNEVILHRCSTDEDFAFLSQYNGHGCDFFVKNGLKEKQAAFDSLKQMPLLRMIQSVNNLFELDSIDDRIHSVYIRAFIDKVQEYCSSYSADILEFLRYWDKCGNNLFIPMPEDDNAVEIMTIFKSKGLEFDAVFIPFFDWDIAIKSGFENIRMLNVKNSDFHHPNVNSVPVNIANGKDLLDSYFSDEILDEFQNCSLDVLNIMYVATTRAKKELYVNALIPQNTTASGAIGKINLPELTREILKASGNVGKYDENTGIYEYGEPISDEMPVDASKKDGLTADFLGEHYPVASIEENESRMTLHYHKSDTFLDNYEAINKGIVMHSLFERINTVDDIDNAIKSLEEEGDINPSQKEDVYMFVNSLFENETIASWFSDEYSAFNETEIYDSRQDKIYRPDRILFNRTDNSITVIDYKFGEKNAALHGKYEKQVDNYMNILKEMGCRSVKGYILYAKDQTISEVS